MAVISVKENLISKLNYIAKSKLWGKFFIGEYYFTINTNKTKIELGLKDTSEIPPDIQIKLQYDNFPAIFHEYIHYVHEISTLIGSISLFFEVYKRSLFSSYFNSDLNSSEYLGFDFMDKQKVQKLSKILVTEEFIFGDNNSKLEGCIFIKPISILKVPIEIHFPYGQEFVSDICNQVEIEYEYLSDGRTFVGKLYFGKYFIYEGLAYELDRVVDKQIYNKEVNEDNLKGTEYTVLRGISKYLFPDIDLKSYLSLASLSLSYINPAETFIQFVNELKSANEKGIPQGEYISHVLQKTKNLLLSGFENYKESLVEIKNVFIGRQRLYKSFSFLTEQYEKAYLYRANNPIFEVNNVLDGTFRKIVDIVPLCDFIYEFSDKIDFDRDFLGTTLENDISDSLKTLLSYSHYFKAHTNFQSTKIIEASMHTSCPFYYCCKLDLRIKNEDICYKKPWRIFEISSNIDNQFCWYGQGVLEFKGHNKLI